MKVLLSNDDGIRSPGLRAVYTALREAGHQVQAVAPMSQQSGVSQAITVFEPLRSMSFEEENFSGIGIYGTPVDCVKLALGALLPQPPDLVISGINLGPNIGSDILYSGTVGAASEGVRAKIPSIALSYYSYTPEDLLPHARHAVALAMRIDWSKINPRCLLNINYPDRPLEQTKGLKVCPPTQAEWQNAYDERKDPRGMPYWWLAGEFPSDEVAKGTDKDLLDQGYITLSPISLDLCDQSSLQALETMHL